MYLLRSVIVIAALVSFLSQGPEAVNRQAEGIYDSVQNFAYQHVLPGYGPVKQAEMTDEAQLVGTEASPSVVTIFGQKKMNSALDDLGNPKRWPNFMEYTKVSSGTGFFVDENGYIMTNRHVVADENVEYTAILSNGKRRSATVTYRDPARDIAVLKIEGSGYQPLNLGDSSKLKVGQAVVGIGNAYAREGDRVSPGSVAALNRLIVAGGENGQQMNNVIQTNAQLYPGDSGGPLLNTDGEVIGVNVAIAVNREHVSFSIPINEAKKTIRAAMELASL